MQPPDHIKQAKSRKEALELLIDYYLCPDQMDAALDWLIENRPDLKLDDD